VEVFFWLPPFQFPFVFLFDGRRGATLLSNASMELLAYKNWRKKNEHRSRFHYWTTWRGHCECCLVVLDGLNVIEKLFRGPISKCRKNLMNCCAWIYLLNQITLQFIFLIFMKIFGCSMLVRI
jgi:hypothetical protein